MQPKLEELLASLRRIIELEDEQMITIKGGINLINSALEQIRETIDNK